MKKVAVLVLEEAVMASVVDAHTIFTGVNGFKEAEGEQAPFDIRFVGLKEEVRLHNCLFTIRTDLLLKDLDTADLVIIPAISGDFVATLERNQAFIKAITRLYGQGAEAASLCSGAFVLAATGLLNGKECSSHWLSANLFRELYPEVRLVDARIVTEQEGLYSSGGANSYWNLLLHLVEKYVDREMAIRAAKVFALEIDRRSQSPFAMFNGQKNHEDEPIRLAQEFIEQHIDERISVEELSAQFAIGQRHFTRRFKKATNNTPAEYIQRVKIEAAKKKLETSSMNVNEVMYEVGYVDLKTFRTVFKKLTGLSPLHYRNKYNKKAAAATG